MSVVRVPDVGGVALALIIAALVHLIGFAQRTFNATVTRTIVGHYVLFATISAAPGNLRGNPFSVRSPCTRLRRPSA